MLSQLLVHIGITGTSRVESELSRVDKAINRTASGAKSAGRDFDGAGMSMLALAAAAGGAIAQIGGFAKSLNTISGVGIAAQFQRLEMGFTAVIGNAQKAQGLLKEIQKIGAASPFETREVAKFARDMLAAGFSANTLADDLKAITNMAGALGRDTFDVGRMTGALGRIRRDINKVDADELNEFANAAGLPISRIVSKARGKQMSDPEAAQLLQSLKPEEAARVLIDGIKKEFGNANFSGGLLTVINNIGDAFSNVMLPTGKLLLPVVEGLGKGILAVGGALQNVNEMTGGQAGLAILLTGAWKAGTLFTGTLKTARVATESLILSLQKYSGVAGSAAVAGAIGAAGSALNPFAGAPAAGKAVPINGLRASIGRAGGILPAIKGFGKSALGFAGRALKGGGAAILADIGLNYLGGRIGGKGGAVLSGIGSGIGWGALGGSIIGSVVPILGTAVGGAVGAAVGGVIGGIQSYMGYKDRPASAGGSDDMAKNMKSAADSLKDIRATLIGGGPIGRRVSSELEIEAAFGRIIATGIG